MTRSRTMRLLLSAVLMSAAGCQAHKQVQAKDKDAIKPAGLDAEPYEAVTASALVFDPPVSEYSAAVPSRDGRERTAFVGYDSVISTYFYIRTDDRDRFFSPDGDGRYERRAITERFGVSQR